MKILVAILIATGCLCLKSNAQLVCLNAASADTTSYTNGLANDSVYFICQGQSATVVATPTSGEGNWDFVWYYFTPANNSWTYANEDLNLTQSSRNLPQGGFRVDVFDNNGVLTDQFVCWVCRVLFAPVVNANTIPAGCTGIQLSGVYFPANVSAYYNKPNIGPQGMVSVDADTEIEICIAAEHSFVSDLSFYLVGPASCGSPSVPLSIAPVELGQDPLCNFGSGVNLCFSSESTNNLDVCSNAPTSLIGTYGSYGPSSTPIAWSLLNGCDANSPDWSVQIYDCVTGDEGQFVDATITFQDEDSNGDPATILYSTIAGSQPILDNTCTSETALQATMVVPASSAVSIPIVFSTVWVADPPFFIPNSVNNFNLYIENGPTVDTEFTLKIVGPNLGTACDGNLIDTEFYDYIVPEQAITTTSDDVLCTTDTSAVLTSTIADGIWFGTGIGDESAGMFDPSLAGPGLWTVYFLPYSACITSGELQILVAEAPAISLTPVAELCSNEAPFFLQTNVSGGLWSGEGIENNLTGLFNPSAVSDASAQVIYTVPGECPASDTMLVEIESYVPLSLSSPEEVVCLNAENLDLGSNVSGGSWSGEGISNSNIGIFDPSVAGVGEWTIQYSYSGVCADSGSLTIVVDDPTIDVVPVSPICIESGTITLSGTPLNGYWSGDGITNALTGVFNPMSIGIPGDYTVYYQIDNACKPIDSVVVSVEGIPDIIMNLPDGVCPESDIIYLNANISGGVWSGDAIVNATSGAFDPSIGIIGMNSISYSIDDVCDASETGVLEIYSSPVIIASEDTSICYGEPAILSVSGGGGYSWIPTTGLNTILSNNPIAQPTSSITYTVTGYSAEGCADSDEVYVEVYPLPDVIVNGPFEICEDETVQLQASGLIEYYWTGEGLSDYYISNPLASPTDSTIYFVSGVDANGCEGSDSIEVNILWPHAEFIPSAVSGVSALEVDFQNISEGDVFYWDFGNGMTGTTNSLNEIPTSEFTGEQTYTVTLTALLGDCPDTFSMEINSYYDSEFLLIPNVVTIDGNNKNDEFRFLTQNMKTLQVEIFDRWGKKVGIISRPEGSWDPSEFGAGTYYYTMTAEGLDRELYSRSGTFTVLEKTKN